MVTPRQGDLERECSISNGQTYGFYSTVNSINGIHHKILNIHHKIIENTLQDIEHASQNIGYTSQHIANTSQIKNT